MSASDAPSARRARDLVMALVVLVCAVFVVWHLARYSRTTATFLCVLGVGPWLLMIRPLWRGVRPRYAAATLLTAPYIGYGLMEVLANPGARPYAGALVLLSFGLFVALTTYLRVSRPPGPTPT